MPRPLYIRMLLLLLVVFCRALSGNGQVNTAGGEINYEFLRRIPGETSFNVYRVTYKLFKQCTDPSELPNSVHLNIFRVEIVAGNAYYYKDGELDCDVSRLYTTIQMPNDCSPDAPLLCYQVGVYTVDITFKETFREYIVAVQDNARKKADYANVHTDGIGKPSGGIMGYTHTNYIPSGLPVTPLIRRSSPVFKKEYPLILCAGKPFRYDFSANDPDGDSLSYRFLPATQGRIYVVPRATNGTADWPPFLSLIYKSGFTPVQPFGTSATIDPVSGMISGMAPATAGRYLVVVEVTKHRDGQVVARHRKESTFVFSTCTWPTAQLDSTYRNCSGTSVKFLNYSTGNIGAYSWDFGDPTTNRDTSSQAEPTYNYPAPGVYTATLYLNKGTSLCKDSTTCEVIVDTGLNASFTALRSIAVCNEALYEFTNSSTEGANPITSYAWDFGEVSTTADISSVVDPSYTYPTDGDKMVRLIIKNSIGCSDTAFKSVKAFKSLMQAPNDTSICILDAIRLQTNTNGYPGVFNWSPNYNISSLTDPAPTVNPQVDTTYYVSFTDATGCVAQDSVRVEVRDTVAIQLLNADTTICRLDTIRLLTEHDGLSVTWRPVASVIPVNPDGSAADAFPNATTDIIATVHFGSCFAEDTMNIKVVPRPQVTISNDTTVCFGAPVYLQASGGAYYLWTPAATLNNPVSPNPVASPVANTIYTVSVYDTLGCPKHTMASVTVNTYRALYALAEKDTMVVEGEPVQLQGSGGQYYQWSPPQFLSDPTLPNPIARTYGDVIYTMKISDDDGCTDSAKVRIRAFKDPDIYVPTAFTPNNDGRNDLFKVFPVGFTLQELKIFDRWGNVVFVTSDPNKGWDGSNKGVVLGTGTFVWTATGINKKTGKTVFKKGNITLIR